MTLATIDFDTAYREHVGDVHRFIFRFVQDAGVAEDLTQEAFVKAYRAWDTFRGEVPARIWLLRIARNVCIDHLRSPRARGRQPASLDDLEDQGLEPDSEQSPLPGAEPPLSVEQSARQAEMSTCVQEFVLGLPETLRTPLLLHDVEGMTNAEIAEVLGCSLAAAKMRLHRARAQLRQIIEDNCELFGDERNVLSCLPAPPSPPPAPAEIDQPARH